MGRGRGRKMASASPLVTLLRDVADVTLKKKTPFYKGREKHGQQNAAAATRDALRRILLIGVVGVAGFKTITEKRCSLS